MTAPPEVSSTAFVDAASDSRWAALTEAVPSDVFHSPAWARVLRDTYEFDVQAALALDDRGEVIAGVPFVRVDDVFGERVVALPFSDYCDPIGDDRAWPVLADALLGFGAPVRIRPLHREAPLQDARFEQVRRACWHGIDLAADEDAAWAVLEGSARRAVRKARSRGVEVRAAAGKDELRAFFELHLDVRRQKYRLLAQPYRFFETIWDEFVERDRGTLLLAYADERLLAGTLYLGWRDGLYYKFNASAPDSLNERPNDLLSWEGIRLAIERGLRRFDFGLSDEEQDGLRRFKRKFGAEERTIAFLGAQLDGDVRAPAGELLGQLTELLTGDEVPAAVSEAAGDLLYRNFA